MCETIITMVTSFHDAIIKWSLTFSGKPVALAGGLTVDLPRPWHSRLQPEPPRQSHNSTCSWPFRLVPVQACATGPPDAARPVPGSGNFQFSLLPLGQRIHWRGQRKLGFSTKYRRYSPNSNFYYAFERTLRTFFQKNSEKYSHRPAIVWPNHLTICLRAYNVCLFRIPALIYS